MPAIDADDAWFAARAEQLRLRNLSRANCHAASSSEQASAIDIFQPATALTTFGQDVNLSVHYTQPTTIHPATGVAGVDSGSAHSRELAQHGPAGPTTGLPRPRHSVSKLAYLISSSPMSHLLVAGTAGVSNPRSCDLCRQRKLKCTRQRPCSACMSRGLSARCNAGSEEGIPAVTKQGSSSESTALYRPISTARQLQFTLMDSVNLAKVAISCKLHPVLMHRLADIGTSKEMAMSILLNLPPSVCSVLDTWIPAVSTLYFQILQNTQKLEKLQSPRKENPAEEDPTLEDTALKIGHDRWFAIVYDPKSGLRKYCQVGREMEQVVGMHSEEYLTRVAANDILPVSTEVDIFCNLIFSMLCPGQRNSTIFTRVNRVPSGAHNTGTEVAPYNMSIVRQTIHKVIDSHGRLRQAILAFDNTSEEDFNSDLSTSGINRPFAETLGDTRNYQELFDTHKIDMQFRGKLSYWRRSAPLRLKLDSLALVMAEEFQKNRDVLCSVLERQEGQLRELQ